MTRALPLILALAVALPGCARLAESRLNPLNWFGPSVPSAAQGPLVPEGASATYDLRQPVAQVTGMAIEPTVSGAILRATGVAPGQGWFNAQLVETGRADGVLTYDFRVEAPAAPGGGQQVVTVARSLDAADLAGISVIRVQGQSNAREARR
jgi:hypothetical protein